MNKALLTTAIALALAGCATDSAYLEGERLLAEGKTDAGLRQLEQAVRDDPKNVQYRTSYLRALDQHVKRLLDAADAALKEGQEEAAEALYRDILAISPNYLPARTALKSIEIRRRNRILVSDARLAFQKGEMESARVKLRTVLALDPGYAEAQELIKQVEEKIGKPQGAEFHKLAELYRRPVTLQFRDTPVRTLFDALSRQSGINFVFDKDVRTDARLTIFAQDTPIIDAIEMMLRTGQLEKKVLNDNTLLIYPSLPAKIKEYRDLVVKGFFLGDTDVKQIVNLVRSMTKTRDIYIDEKLNLLVVRDSPEAVRLVEKLVKLADRPEPEVMLEVEIMEVKRSRMLELGIQWPNQLSVLTPEVVPQTIVQDGVVITEQVPRSVLTLENLQNVTSADIAVSPNPALTLRKDTGDANILANPRIRVKNKEKAKIHIGDKVPVITSNVTSTGVTSESVSYLDVGLKVDVEPLVRLEGDVEIRVGLEVSNIVQVVKSTNGTQTYQLGSRNASTMLRLKDGETQILAGLIADEERNAATKVPGLGDLPLLGRLFSNNSDQLNKTEIVLLITPRIIRNVVRPELADSEFFGGTESVASDQALQLRSGPQVRSRPGLRPGARAAGTEALEQTEPAGPVELPAEPDSDLPPEPVGDEKPVVEGVPVGVPAVPPMQPSGTPAAPAQ
jgi:general secretion pathway protein D